MKNYILTVIGNFESPKVCKEITWNLIPLVDSPTLKFNHSNGVLVVHFATKVTKIEVYTYIIGVLTNITQTFILTEINDHTSVSFSDEVYEHLMDLETESENVNMKIDLNKIKKNQDFCDFDDEDDDDWVTFTLDETELLLKKPTLDFILDKISKSGIKSLTEYEKDTLDSYSKN